VASSTAAATEAASRSGPSATTTMRLVPAGRRSAGWFASMTAAKVAGAAHSVPWPW
jgi:hypothetical protein